MIEADAAADDGDNSCFCFLLSLCKVCCLANCFSKTVMYFFRILVHIIVYWYVMYFMLSYATFWPNK